MLTTCNVNGPQMALYVPVYSVSGSTLSITHIYQVIVCTTSHTELLLYSSYWQSFGGEERVKESISDSTCQSVRG